MKSTISLTLDSEVLMDIREQHINISSLINNFLKEFVKEPSDDQRNYILNSLKARIQELEKEKKERKTEKKKVIIHA